MASLEDIKKLLEEEIRPLPSKLLSLEDKFCALEKSVDYVSGKYDELLNQIQIRNDKVTTLTSDVKNMKQELSNVKKGSMNVANEIDDLAQYLRRDCIEISGVQATEENLVSS